LAALLDFATPCAAHERVRLLMEYEKLTQALLA